MKKVIRTCMLATALSLSYSGIASAATVWDHSSFYDAGGIKLSGSYSSHWGNTKSDSWTFDLTPGFDPATETATSGEIWLNLRDDKDKKWWWKSSTLEFAQLTTGDEVSGVWQVISGTATYELTSLASINADGTLNVTLTATKGDFYFDDATLVIHDIPAVPVPAAVWLFGSGLLGLVGVARARRKV